MIKRVGLLVFGILTMLLVACGNGEEKLIPEQEVSKIVTELEQLQSELESLQSKLNDLESLAEKDVDEELIPKDQEEEEGYTIATSSITVPDPATQMEFIVEVTPENFLSIFEFITVNQYNKRGEYTSKRCGFSSLLYEHGWALGFVEDFEVDYVVFGDMESRDTFVGSVQGYWSVEDEEAEPDVRIYDAKGTLTFYPIESVYDEVRIMTGNDAQGINRTLPDGSRIMLYTDLEGNFVY